MTIPSKKSHGPVRDLMIARKQISDYAMALDLLAEITHSDNEDEAVEHILGLFIMLFSPQHLHYITLEEDSKLGRIYPKPVSAQDDSAIRQRAHSFTGDWAWTNSGKGFWMKLTYKNNPFGLMILEDISFPEYKDHYLNLALSIMGVCGLAIENARKHEQLKKSENSLRQEKEKAEAALAEVKKLSGLLPICSHCKKVRDDQGYWNRIEAYIENHSEAQFSHSICQECLDKLYPNIVGENE